MEWQPIETAPKDGTDILLYSNEGVFQGNFIDSWDGWHPLTLDYHGCGCCSEGRPIPTHWMPLPSPPPAKEVE